MTDVYKRLAKKLDKLPHGFPATDSGVELKILRKIFSDEDAETAVQLKVIPETVEKISGRLGKTASDTRETLERMKNRGQIQSTMWRGERRYSLAPFVVGIFEYQLPFIDRELAELCEACTRPRQGLESLYAVLTEETTAFDGQVVMAVGDTHVFRVDKPLYEADGSVVENFTRVETFGEPDVHWVRVRVDPTERSVFSFHQEIVPSPRLLGGWPGVPGGGRRTAGSGADASASAR